MFNLFKRICKHEAKHLAVSIPEPVVTPHNEMFDDVTFKLVCQKCGEHVDISCLKVTDEVKKIIGV